MGSRVRGRNGIVTALVACAAIALSRAQSGQTQAPSCEVDLHMAFDTSGSMDTKDPACLRFLRDEVHNDPAYEARKPCWELINTYVRTSHDLVASLCSAAGQPEPRISMVSFRCPGTGKDRKIILEPTNDRAAIEAGYAILENQALTGQSCAFGALDQVSNWVRDGYNQTNREAGVSSAVADPDAPVTKRPVLLLVTDGILNNGDGRIGEAETLRNVLNVTLVAANVFPDARSIARLSELTERGFILDASDADALKSLSLRVGSYVTRIEDLDTCSAAQLACARTRRAALNASEDDSGMCGAQRDLYTALASCAAAGCVGLDLTPDKDACLASECGDEAGGCHDIATHINAQNYGPDGESGFGLDQGAAAPGFMWRNRVAGSALAVAGALEPQFAVTELRGGLGAPVFDAAGNVLVGGGNELLCLSAASGEVQWRARADQGGDATGAEFSAPVVIGGGSVFVGASDGAFYMLAEGSGEVERVWQLGGRVRAAAALPDASDYVLVVSDAVPGVRGAMLHKLRVDGTQEDAPRAWQRPVCNDTEFDFAVGGVFVTRAQGVVVSCRNGQVELYSLLTGQERWRLYTGGYIEASPAFEAESNSLYVAANDPGGSGAVLIRFDMAGEEVWRSELRHAVDATPALPPSAPGSVLVLGRNGVLYRYDTNFGGAQAEQDVLPEGAVSDFTPALGADGLVVFCHGPNVVVVNASDLTVVASAQLEDDVTSAPLVADGAVFVTTRRAALVRLGSGGRRGLLLRLRAQEGARALHPENEDEWPTSAIAVTVVLALLLLVLASIAAAQGKARASRNSK